MKEKRPTCFLFINQETLYPYLRIFLERNSQLYSKLYIVFINISSTFQIENRTRKICHIILPLPELSNITPEDKERHLNTFSRRFIDFLLVEKLITLEKDYYFFFNNLHQHYILNAVANRVENALIITYVDSLFCQHNKYLYVSNTDEKSNKKKMPRLGKRILEKSNIILAANHNLVSFLTSVYGFNKNKVSKWPCSISSKHLSTVTRKQLKKKESTKQDKLVLLYDIDFTSKDYEKIFRLFRDGKYKTKFLIVGPVDISKFPNEFSLRQKLIFIGDLNGLHLIKYGQLADLVIVKNRKPSDTSFLLTLLLNKIPTLVFKSNWIRESGDKIFTDINKSLNSLSIPQVPLETFIEKLEHLDFYLFLQPETVSPFLNKSSIRILKQRTKIALRERELERAIAD